MSRLTKYLPYTFVAFGACAATLAFRANSDAVNAMQQDYKIDSLRNAIDPDFKAIDSAGMAAYENAYEELYQKSNKPGQKLDRAEKEQILAFTAPELVKPMIRQIALIEGKHPGVTFKVNERLYISQIDDEPYKQLSLTATTRVNGHEVILKNQDYFELALK